MAAVIDSQYVSNVHHSGVVRIPIAWTSSSGGTYTEAVPAIRGEVVRVVFKPGESGSQSSNNYVATITDAEGMDILAGQGAALSNTATTNVAPGVPVKDGTTTSVGPMIVAGTITLNVSSAGNAKSGTVVLYVR